MKPDSAVEGWHKRSAPDKVEGLPRGMEAAAICDKIKPMFLRKIRTVSTMLTWTTIDLSVRDVLRAVKVLQLLGSGSGGSSGSSGSSSSSSSSSSSRSSTYYATENLAEEALLILQ